MRSTMRYQDRVAHWMDRCFGPETSYDTNERSWRFLEEAIELVQSLNCTKEAAHQLVDYVYSRPKGDTEQEIGCVMVTLAALAEACKINMHDAGDKELRRVFDKIDIIRAKHLSKPRVGPLPGKDPETCPKCGAPMVDPFSWNKHDVEKCGQPRPAVAPASEA